MSDRERFTTGNPFERQIGFSRAVRVGDLVLTAGTVAVDQAGQTQGADCYEQMCFILEKLQGILAEAGSSLEHVVRVVCYLTRMEDAAGFAQAHHEYFGAIRPAATCVVVKQLFGSGTLVEVELTAVVPAAAD